MRRLLPALLVLLAAPILGADPPVRKVPDNTMEWNAFFGPASGEPTSPSTLLLVTKNVDGTSVDLNWTCDQPTATFQVFRGLLGAPFEAHVLVATTDGLTWTDTDAMTRTVLGVAVDEYYYVFGGPEDSAWCSVFDNAALAYEYGYPPVNKSQIVAVNISNEDQFSSSASLSAPGRDSATKLVNSKPSVTDGKTYLFDAYNLPTKAGVASIAVASVSDFIQYSGTVDHCGYYSGTYETAAAGDQTLTTTQKRAVPTPVASKVSNTVTLTWVAPDQDVAGTVKSIKVYRDYLGVGDADSTLLTTLGPAVLTYADDITAVTSNYYVFYTIALEYQDGQVSYHSPSTAAVRR